jgi:hypothetical protein
MGLKSMVGSVVLAQFFGEEFLPTVPFIGIIWVSVFLSQRSDVSAALEILRIDACRAGEEKSVHAVQTAGLQQMGADQDVISSGIGVVEIYVPNPTHVGGEMVNLVYLTCGHEAIIQPAKVQYFELIRFGGFILRLLDVNTADPIPLFH